MIERLVGVVGAAIGLSVAFVWIMWRMRAIAIPAFVIGLALGLAACAPIEGAGFTNNGRPAPPACLLSRKGNVERWGDCPRGRHL
jgi:hypothetical protein